MLLFLVVALVQAQRGFLYAGLYNSSITTCPSGSAESDGYSSPSVLAYRLGGAAAVPAGAIPAGLDVSWIVAHPTRDIIYAVSEVCQYKGRASGSIAAFAVRHHEEGTHFELLNRVSTEDAGPVFASIDKLGKTLIVAHYFGEGSLVVFPIQHDGSIGAFTDIKKPFTNSHSVYFAPTNNKHVLSVALGDDQVNQFVLSADGRLEENPFAAALSLPASSGPRHLAFHPFLPLVLIADEGDGSGTPEIQVCDYDREQGTLKYVESIIASNATQAEGLFPAEIVMTDHGRFAYVSVRDAAGKQDSIALFSIKEGSVSLVSNTPVGFYPRSIYLDSSRDMLWVANQKANSIISFHVDIDSGKLSQHGEALMTPDAPGFVIVAR